MSKARRFVIPAGLVASDATTRLASDANAGASLASDATNDGRLASDAKPGSIPHDFVPVTEEDLARCLADPLWRLCSGQLYKIKVKSAHQDEEGSTFVVPFKPNRAQRRLMSRLWYRNIILKARQLGFCVDPSTRVLTADLRWVPIAELEAGMEVVAVDEHPPGGRGQARRMRTATVQAKRVMQAERFRITFSDGREVICTANHPWLTRKTATDAKWRSLSGEGNQVTGRITVGTQVRWITKPWEAAGVEDGWFGGMLDGEGSMALPSRAGASVNVSQREGAVFERLKRYAKERGYSARIEGDEAEREHKHGRVPVPKLAFTRMDEMFRLIGQTRPTRFIDRRWWEGRELPGKRNSDVGWATVTSIEPLGMGDVVDMQTSTGTYIAEGFVSHNTTLVAVMWLDHALFNANQSCAIIAQDKDKAEEIFRDKVRFAYDNLPPSLRASMPLERDMASELRFAHNGSVFKVTTSARGGTIHRLHVSEYGKICAKFPDKAEEIKTGSFPAVPLDGITIIESTAEGQEGDFFEKTKIAIANAQTGKELNQRDYRLHFFAWWADPGYRMNPAGVLITDNDRAYFAQVEAATGTRLSIEQQAWYVATREADFSGDPEKMWQEYPSTAKEAFQVSTEGVYYAVQLATMRKEGRIGRVPYTPGVPVNTFWDIGASDGTAIWLHQRVGFENRFIGFIEAWSEPYSHFVRELQSLKYVWDTHYLPHDAGHKRQQGDRVCSPEDELRESPLGGTWLVLPAVDEVQHGIQKTREAFGTYWMDAEKCAKGIAHLDNYRKTWDRTRGCWRPNVPAKGNGHSEAADALRQHGQGYVAPSLIRAPQGRANWRVA